MTLPLEGVRVLDFTRMFAGPWGTEILNDLGAEVLKVEAPRVGDPTRRSLPFWGSESAYFMTLNRGKKSVTLDLKQAEGRDAALKLASTCDVVMENYRPGVMGRLGLDYASVSQVKPDIVYCSLSGFGATGPLRDSISFDLVNQAMSGLIDLTGEPGESPVRIGVPIGDQAGGFYLALAALSGLLARRATGEGSWTELSLHDGLISLLGHLGQQFLESGENPTRTGNRHRLVAPYGCYEVADGWLVVCAAEETAWQRLTDALGIPRLQDDQRFRTGRDRKRHEAALDAALMPRLREHTIDEWGATFAKAGVPSAPVMSVKDALASELIQGRGVIFDADHPDVGTVRNLASPLVLGGQRLGLGGVSPTLGADTVSVLREIGIDDAQLADLAERAVIRSVDRPNPVAVGSASPTIVER
jgi:crotonobetainyl-CoA:carnitine CoA-transferase CaiB-like acyl-CoA transferase